MTQNAENVREIMKAMQERDQNLYLVTVTVAHFADTLKELNNDTESIMSRGKSISCDFLPLTAQQLHGLNTALPYARPFIQADRLLLTQALAGICPFAAQEIYYPGGSWFGTNAKTKRLLVINRDLLMNGNSMVLATTGGGKSFHLKEEAAQVILKGNADVIFLDLEKEYVSMTQKLGGSVISFSPSTSHSINPLDIDADDDERHTEIPFKEKVDFVMSFCQMLMSEDGSVLDGKLKTLIDRCVRKIYEPMIASGYQIDAPLLSDLRAELLRQPEPEARELALRMEIYTNGSFDMFSHKVQEGVKANASGGNTAGTGELLKAQSIQSYQAVRQEYGEQAQPKGAIKLILCLCLAVFTLLSMLFSSCAVLAGAYSQSQTGHAVHINRRVQSYRPLIVRWAEADGVSAYVDVLLALCMAESGVAANPGDPFQCSESGYNTRYPHAPNSITDYKYSIEIGVLTFAKSIEYAGCTSPSDRNRLFKALQAYNMGPGFIDFCNARYNGVWSFECAKAFSDYMGGHYGNPNYINQFLEFYEFGALLPGADTADEYTGTPNPAGLCWPLGNIGRDCITQHYGGMFSGEPHRGMDIGVAHGTPIYAAAAGTVSVANSTDSWGYSWGYYVKIKHSEVHDTLYAHMSRVVVTQGQTVQQGQLIGYVGNTGNSFGAHLHFELYLNGTRVDPEPYIDTDKITEYLCSHT